MIGIRMEDYHEAYKNTDNKRLKGIHEKGRLRRVPDFLPVSLQDFLYRGKPELRKGEIIQNVRAM